MMLFRRATLSDLDAIHALALESGIGMTTLPKDPLLLEKRLRWSCESFAQSIDSPLNEYYLFVLEDTDSQQIVGTSAVEAAIGYDTPFYSYKVSRRTRISHTLGIRSDYSVLSLVNDNQGHSEICTLYLNPEFRKNGNGLLLSRARFLFMAHHPQRFAPTIIAEMRGVSDEQGCSPFWEHVMQHFFKMPFPEADRLTLSTNKQYIADLMPRNPIYVALIHPEAQAVIGKPHRSTEPAMKILQKEGFRYSHYVDIFDGGPTIEAPLHEIKTISSSRLYTITSLSDEVSSRPYLLANTSLDYRCTLGNVIFNHHKKTCVISRETAMLLQVNVGNGIRLAPLKREAEIKTTEGELCHASQ
ncbi:MAG: arginine N-succinyltransferase [Legionellaceae bacterium]|nr:arginine N-succinyltransferase [Legionellaceae bacterium]